MLLAKANMLWLLTAFLLLLPTSSCPPPSAQSSLQAQLRAAALVEAPARSANATPHLLSLLDEKDFRDAIANLTSLAELPSKDLLELYRQGLALSPIVHNFDTRYLPLLLNQSNNASEYLLNDWDLFGTLRPLPDNETGSLAVEEWAETRVFPGLPPFAPSLQCSLAACQQRPQYFMLDNWAFAGGDSFFGQMSLTLAQEATEKLAVVVPMDSGTYAQLCAKDMHHVGVDCRAWADSGFAVGAFGALDHVILANLDFFRPSLPRTALLGQQFNRMFAPASQPLPSMGAGYASYYLEVMVLGNLFLNKDKIQSSVRSITVAFNLFGTARGDELAMWAAKAGIGMLWNIGQFYDNSPPTITSPQQFLDPSAPPYAHNVTASPSFLAAFTLAKAAVRNATAGGTVYQPDSWWLTQWRALWGQADQGMKVRNLQPGACVDTARCFGLDPAGHCLCVASA